MLRVMDLHIELIAICPDRMRIRLCKSSIFCDIANHIDTATLEQRDLKRGKLVFRQITTSPTGL